MKVLGHELISNWHTVLIHTKNINCQSIDQLPKYSTSLIIITYVTISFDNLLSMYNSFILFHANLFISRPTISWREAELKKKISYKFIKCVGVGTLELSFIIFFSFTYVCFREDIHKKNLLFSKKTHFFSHTKYSFSFSVHSRFTFGHWNRAYSNISTWRMSINVYTFRM